MTDKNITAKKICLTGIKSTGVPHLGNYLGAFRPSLNLANSNEYEGFFFIADYHSVTTIHKPEILRAYIDEIAATWLALGLNTDTTTLYQQSQIPEILELSWILSCVCGKGLMNRAHAYKAIVQDNLEHGRDPDQNVNIGIFTYPILMSADILFLKTNVVPVGPDQLQHIEIARDLAQAFNHLYGNIMTVPEALVREAESTIVGLDGRKMSKSYDNTIPLFLPEKQLQKLINKIKTDSLPPEAPKNPDDSLIFDLYRRFASEKEIQDLREWYIRGIGWGEAKHELFKVINRELQDPREIYHEYMACKTKIKKILDEGTEKVRPRAIKFLQEVKRAVGVL